VEAVSLKNDIEREFGAPVRVRAGLPGSLDVYVDGEQIYSKRRTGRLPTAAELIELIRGKLPSR
jgi:selT/selW/selH-like putative selenoprotein